ncbi:DUF4355 domain-containing protein [Levilactobacillus brevis]|uniref:DUF4355 domain-containing protein n=1 Tax=Levilactobacillus brevis TaxID=1580 RepID=UPI0011634DC7|nr:DUF4355 domain-containing protein [Levilactobacillus brevis]QCZ43727.1 hypothetical protein UCCLBBS124_1403 [Levilactobacillus brevis]
MLKRDLFNSKLFEAPDDNNGAPADGQKPTEPTPPAEPNPDDDPKGGEPNKVPIKDQRRIRQDAINQFKSSNEFKQLMADTIAEGEKRAKMSAEEKAEADRKAQEERDQQERDKFHQEQAHFYAQQELASRHLPDTFADYIADQDHDTMIANVDSFEKSFNEAVHDETLKRMQGDQTPASGNQTPDATVTKKDWDSMSYSEQLAIYQKNPQLAQQFMN